MIVILFLTLLGGEFCDQPGLSQTSGLCSPGYYCTEASDTATPTDGVMGDYCQAGHFCPEGSSYQTPCTPGRYCGADYLNVTSGPCDPGYYCHSSASIPNPTDGNITGQYTLDYEHFIITEFIPMTGS